MLTERISGLGNWAIYQLEWLREAHNFHRVFGYNLKINGVLSKPDQEIDPIYRGFVTVDGSYNLYRKRKNQKPLSNEERRKAREAAWQTSFSGNFLLGHSLNGGTIAKITLDNEKVMHHLTRNADEDNIIAFLSYRDNNHNRYKTSSSVKITDENGQPWVNFDFPTAQNIPDDETSLLIYTHPKNLINVDKKLTRIRLLLGLPTVNTKS